MLRKIVAWFSLGMLFTVIVVIILALPIIWLNELVGNLFGGGNKEAKYVDYREELDVFGANYHLAFDYSELIACTMHKEYNNDITKCVQHIDAEGKWDGKIDIDLAPVYAMYKGDIKEYKGYLNSSGYIDLRIPTLYERDIYKEVTVIDEETKDETIEIEFDYTEETIYKEKCDEHRLAKCRIVREGFYTFPYIAPKGVVADRYGYQPNKNEDETPVEFHNYVIINLDGQNLNAISTATVIETGIDDEGKYILMKVQHNGLNFYVRYSQLNEVVVKAGQEVEWNEKIGVGWEIKMKTYILKDDQEQYFNPFLLYGEHIDYRSLQLLGQEIDYGIGAYDYTEYDPSTYMGDEKFKLIYDEAVKHLGKPYRLGTEGPNIFDCSGFIYYVFNQTGVKKINRVTANDYYRISIKVPRDDARPGDLVFFRPVNESGKITHVGIYLGEGKMIHAGGYYLPDGTIRNSVHISKVWGGSIYDSWYGRLDE